MGRPTASYQETLAQGVMQSCQIGYSYDLSGAMLSETYPSGKIVNMAYDAAGRVITVTKQGGAITLLVSPMRRIAPLPR